MHDSNIMNASDSKEISNTLTTLTMTEKVDHDDWSISISDQGLSVRHFFRHRTENPNDGISMTAILALMTAQLFCEN